MQSHIKNAVITTAIVLVTVFILRKLPGSDKLLDPILVG
jgi:hypothetical protein